MSKNVQISSKVINFIPKVMENWKVELTVERQTRSELKIRKTSFRETYSPTFPFVIAMIPLNYILGKYTGTTNLPINEKDKPFYEYG